MCSARLKSILTSSLIVHVNLEYVNDLPEIFLWTRFRVHGFLLPPIWRMENIWYEENDNYQNCCWCSFCPLFFCVKCWFSDVKLVVASISNHYYHASISKVSDFLLTFSIPMQYICLLLSFHVVRSFGNIAMCPRYRSYSCSSLAGLLQLMAVL